MRKVNFEQGSPEWLTWRKGLLTATDAAMLLGVSPYVTPFKGWQRKVGQAEEQPVNAAMMRGHHDEPIARELFIQEYGIAMEPCCIESEVYKFIGASLDGLSTCGKYILEIKSQRDPGCVPAFHMMQMQHQFLGTDKTAEKGYYVSHWEGKNTTYEVYPDYEWMNEYLPKAQKFWKGCVFFDPPALTCKDYKDMSETESWNGYAREYKKIANQIKQLEELKESYKKELIKLCGENSCAGSGIKVLRKTVKGRIDYEELVSTMNIQDDHLSQFRKPPSQSWMITLDK